MNDLKKAQDCYENNVHPLLKTDDTQCVHTFVDQKVFTERILGVCKDKKVQNAVRYADMLDYAN